MDGGREGGREGGRKGGSEGGRERGREGGMIVIRQEGNIILLVSNLLAALLSFSLLVRG